MNRREILNRALLATAAIEAFPVLLERRAAAAPAPPEEVTPEGVLDAVTTLFEEDFAHIFQTEKRVCEVQMTGYAGWMLEEQIPSSESDRNVNGGHIFGPHTTLVNDKVVAEGNAYPPLCEDPFLAIKRFEDGFRVYRENWPGNTLIWRIRPTLRDVTTNQHSFYGEHRMSWVGGKCLACGATEEEVAMLSMQLPVPPCPEKHRPLEQKTLYYVRARLTIGDLP